MKRTNLGLLLFVGLFLTAFVGRGQEARSPLSEGFDTLAPPGLPTGWSSTRARNPLQDDFTSVASLPRSAPNALLITNATISQGIVSPLISFAGRGAGEVRFSLRRSATFLSQMSIEASTDGGSTFPIAVASGIFPEADSRYVFFALSLPASLHGESAVRIRWVTIAAGSGTTGTLRMDDVEVTAAELTDCAAGRIESDSGGMLEGEPIPVTIIVLNAGVLPLEQWGIRIGWSVAPHSEPAWSSADEITRNDPLAPGDSISVPSTVMPPMPGVLTLCAVAHAGGDRRSINDSAWLTLRVGARPGRIVISEIMNAPAAGDPEWIEIANTGSSPIAVRGWMLGDETDPEGRELAPPGGLLESHGFGVVADDTARLRQLYPEIPPGVPLFSGLPSLNNSGDGLYLRDPTGGVSDSVRFTPLWHHPALVTPVGRSLEKVVLAGPSSDGRNWGSSVDPAGGTPGRSNSISISAPSSGTSLSASPNPFSPDNDGREDRTIIRYLNSAGGGTLTLRIFDVRGRLVRIVANNEPCAGEGMIIWDGLDENRRRVRIGIYVILAEIVPPGGGPVQSAKGSVVVAGRL